MFDRVLIANRGEIVARVARTARRLGVSPATVYEPGDAGLHVRTCDVAVEIPSYLDVDAVVAAALRCGAQAIHPGYGFLSERASLARACAEAGLAWVGPPAEAIELMGDKAVSKAAAERAGVPIVPGLHTPELTDEQIVAFARTATFPLLVKASAGGGGKGMRVVRALDELDAALPAARREAMNAFGDDTLLIERYVAPSRHIEVQVLADAHGNVISLGERECTLQRRHQKVLEEAPSPVVDAALRAQLGEEATSLARECGYVGAGTVEFVADAHDPRQHFFLEMNTRLQVEHPVTELVQGLDLVEWQLRVAAGEPLTATPREPIGHAVEVRVYAEDPDRGFLPATGPVLSLALPDGEGVRVDAGLAAGDEVTTRYDPMIAKVIAHGSTRDDALRRLTRALEETAVLGLRTNVGFLHRLVTDPAVRAGDVDTHTIESGDWTDGGDAAARAHAAVVAAIAGALDAPVADVFSALPGWRLNGTPAATTARVTVDGEADVEVVLAPPFAGGTAHVDGTPVSFAVLGHDGPRLRLALDGEVARWTAARDGRSWWVARAGRTWHVTPAARALRGDAGGDTRLRAPMPGSVVTVNVAEGDVVARGDVLLVMESMKMELAIAAPVDGTVAELRAAVGDQVARDAELAIVHPTEEPS
jgi:acetyl-CoA/propionyl-CoA carboxylase biotin carboxyl carrier protein